MFGANLAGDRLRESAPRQVDAAGAIGGWVQAVAAHSQQRSPRAADVLAAVGVEPEDVTVAGAGDAAPLGRVRRGVQAGHQDFVYPSGALRRCGPLAVASTWLVKAPCSVSALLSLPGWSTAPFRVSVPVGPVAGSGSPRGGHGAGMPLAGSSPGGPVVAAGTLAYIDVQARAE